MWQSTRFANLRPDLKVLVHCEAKLVAGEGLAGDVEPQGRSLSGYDDLKLVLGPGNNHLKLKCHHSCAVTLIRIGPKFKNIMGYYRKPSNTRMLQALSGSGCIVYSTWSKSREIY